MLRLLPPIHLESATAPQIYKTKISTLPFTNKRSESRELK